MQYIREQRYVCGEQYMEAAIYPVSASQHRLSKRSRQRQAQRLVQANLNDRNRRRHLTQVIYSNFVTGDKVTHPTYNDEHIPPTPELAEKHLDGYLRRIRDRCKFKGLLNPAYIAVTEYQEVDDELGLRAVRPHHHIVMRCDLSRDELELLWNTGGRGCGARATLADLQHSAEPLGLVNVDRLQLGSKGAAEAVAEYITKYPKRKHSYKYSRGLLPPKTPPPSDCKYTRSRLAKVIAERIDDAGYWEQQYKGYQFVEAVPSHNDFTGWSLLVKMWRPDQPHKRDNRQKVSKMQC